MRFSSNRNNSCPLRLIAEVAATPARLPVTVAFGVCPHGAHVFPRKGRQRNVRFVLKIQDSTIFFDCPANFGNFVAHPFISCGLVNFVIQ